MIYSVLFHSFLFFLRKCLKLILWPMNPKLQFENLCPLWYQCKWSMDHTLRNSDLLAEFNFSSMAFKALHNLILVFYFNFISIFHPLPQLTIPPFPDMECTHVHFVFAIWTICHVKRTMVFLATVPLYMHFPCMECPDLLSELFLLRLPD